MTDEQATKNSIQFLAAGKVEKAMCSIIDNTDMPINEIPKCTEVMKVALKAAESASAEIGAKQTIVCVIALVEAGAEDVYYRPIVRCVDERLASVTLSRICNEKNVLESRAAQKN